MNDLISRQAVIDLFPNDALELDTYWGYIAPHFARRMIEELPFAQPEIIRCKDCKYAKCIEQNDDWWECSHDKRVMHGDGFCSWAERKEE